jgi:transcription elongation factor Elf1
VNSRQQDKYRRHIWERTTPIDRVFGCVHCHYSTRLMRAGQNALAATAKLRGRVMKHLRENHPERLEG